MVIKVLHILGGLMPGGAELSLLRILSDWKDNDFEFSVYYIKDYDQLKSGFSYLGISTTHIGWKSERDFWQIPPMVKLFRKARPHIVHTHLWTGNYWVVIAAKLAGVPVILETVHKISDHSGSAFFAHKFLRNMLKYFIDGSISVSNNVKTHLARVYNFSSNNSPVVCNGLASQCEIDSDFREKLREKLKLKIDIPILIAIGNLRPVKGYDTLLHAVSIISKKSKINFHVVIVGGIFKEIPDYMNSLKLLTKELTIEDEVSFMGFQENADDYIYASDLLIMPSYSEGGPITVLEAMRAGTPVIATRTGAVPEYVIDGETGLIVEPGNSGALADAIEFMLRNPGKWKEMGEKGRERFLENFTIDKTVEQLKNLYYHLLKSKNMEIKSTD